VWNRAVLVLVLVGFAALIWNRRWVSDDGLIVLRTVRQLLAGAGPVFNVGERVEANTSTLWTYLLALPGLLPGVSLNWAAVVLGLVASVAGLGLGVDAARRLTAGDRRVLPLGALVVLALPPFWDFGTSGLETGLIVGWLGLTWWLLVRRWEVRRRLDADPTAPAGRAWPVAVVLGLAPLVRPELALFGLLVAAVLVLLEWPGGVRRLLGLAGPRSRCRWPTRSSGPASTGCWCRPPRWPRRPPVRAGTRACGTWATSSAPTGCGSRSARCWWPGSCWPPAARPAPGSPPPRWSPRRCWPGCS
jgi:hypothetical protein